MSTQKSVKLSEYIIYPFEIPFINLDFNIDSDHVVVQSLMVIKPISKDSSKLILKGNKIKLLSILIDGRRLGSKEYNLSDNELIINTPKKSEFELKIKSQIDPYNNTTLEGLYLS